MSNFFLITRKYPFRSFNRPHKQNLWAWDDDDDDNDDDDDDGDDDDDDDDEDVNSGDANFPLGLTCEKDPHMSSSKPSFQAGRTGLVGVLFSPANPSGQLVMMMTMTLTMTTTTMMMMMAMMIMISVYCIA